MPFKNFELSDDSKTITIIKDDDDGGGVVDGVTNDDGKIDVDELMKFDTSALPEEHRGSVDKLKATIGDQIAQLNKLQPKADLSEALMQQLGNQQRVPEKNLDESGDVKKKEVSEKMEFEENDYYAKYFNALNGAIEKLGARIDEVTTSTNSEKQDVFKEKVTTFFKDNKVQPDVIRKMDAVAKELGPNAYKNLPRLLKIANSELGIKEESKVDIDKKTTTSVQSRKNVVDMGGKQKTVTEPKKISNMADAFNQAVEEAAG